jgi:hypothetical protein
MADLRSVRDRTWSLFLEPSPPRRAAFQAAAPELAAAGEEPIESFSIFNKAHLARAMQLVAEMMRRANAAPGDQGLDAALDFFESMRRRENPDLADYALMVFITHHPLGRALTHSIPAITLRNPELAAPSGAVPVGPGGPVEGPPGAELAGVDSDFVGGALPTDNLEWFREDPFANEHHIHWHVVYPGSGVPNPDDPATPKLDERQGEIFFYMHQQMLARYDAERRTLEHPRVAPRKDYGQGIAVGYDPGPYLKKQLYGPRAPGKHMVDLAPDSTVADHAQRRDRLDAAVAGLAFTDGTRRFPSDEVTLLGATLEDNDRGLAFVAGDELGGLFGNLHNEGHIMIAQASTGRLGVMRTPEVAIRDPVFWEWHKHIDDYYALWQDKKGPQDLSDRPLVRLRKQIDPATGSASSPDIILAFEDRLPAEAAGSQLQGWAQQTFGGGHWDEDFSAAADTTTAALETAMLQRTLTLEDRVTSVPLEHLTHRPFVYFFRIENQVDRPVQVTVRVFLAPLSEAADRRAWIEMDKVAQTLQPLEKRVVARRGAQSSVVRKPAVMKPGLLKGATVLFSQQDFDAMVREGLPAAAARLLRPFAGQTTLLKTIVEAVGRDNVSAVFRALGRHSRFTPSEQPDRPRQDDNPEDITRVEASNYCTCGWPYNLLLPRGTEEGLAFRLIVVCTDGEFDQAMGDESCGSLSFCGARDSYPDKRAMGYPFDRPFRDPIADTVMANPNMAFRDIKIRRTPDAVEG